MTSQKFYQFFHQRYLYLLVVIVFILGIAASAYVFFTVKKTEENSLLERTNTIAQMLDVGAIKNLSGSEADLKNDDYLSLKATLQKVLKVNPDTRFIYLMGIKENVIFFYVDSEMPDSPDYSPPGQIYPEASAKCYGAFNYKQGIIEGISTDRWGTWISALTPIIDPSDGRVVAVAGMDIGAWGHIQRMVIYSLPVFLITIFLLVLLFIYISIRGKEMRRMAQKAELVSMAAHEIRSPLTGISWGLESFLETASTRIPKDALETFQHIKISSDDVLKTVNNFLDLYSQDMRKSVVVDAEFFDVLVVLRELVNSFQLAAKQKGVSLFFEAGIENAHISGNKARLKRVFGNLLSNAINYSKQGGQVRLTAKDTHDSYLVSIADNGIGIPKDEQKKIFQGFYRTKGAKLALDEGTGLGLYYVKQIVDLYKGEIWLESKENEGSTFFIKLRKPNNAKPKQ